MKTTSDSKLDFTLQTIQIIGLLLGIVLLAGPIVLYSATTQIVPLQENIFNDKKFESEESIVIQNGTSVTVHVKDSLVLGEKISGTATKRITLYDETPFFVSQIGAILSIFGGGATLIKEWKRKKDNR